MAGSMLVALTFVTLVSGAQYVDYSGVKMPQYGGNSDYDGPRDSLTSSDEYHEHPPDAPAPLDYKYEEDVTGKTDKTLMKEVEETDHWQKHQKKPRRLTRLKEDSNLETLDKYSPDEIVPKFKASHRFSKHRPRLKARNSGREDIIGLKRPVNYVRIKDTDMSDIDSKDDFRDDKGVDFDDDQSNFVNKETTMRVVRRKPRDRFVQSRRAEEDMQRESESEVESDELVSRRLNPERGRNVEYPSSNEERRRRPVSKMFRNPAARYGGATASDDEGIPDDVPEGVPALIRPQLNPKDTEYSEYYDMNRVNSIKNKLPSLLRRTTVARTTATRQKTTLNAYAVMPLRRANALAPFPDFVDETSTTSTSQSATTMTTTSTFSTTSTTTTSTEKPIGDLKALSIAEKSRLSILKKAQRKESSRNESTQKPPVLLQVTNKFQTVVMVEPPTVMEPWIRAKEVSDDTPDRLNKVKRMMRHKLVANAKNIQDLTDNWDDMVCDYIDVSLLDSAANTNYASVLLTFITLLASFTIRRCFR